MLCVFFFLFFIFIFILRTRCSG